METRKKTTTRRKRHEAPWTGGDAAGPDPGSASAGPLADVRGWADVARQAYEDCERGRDAETQLNLRRNRSGE